MTLSNKKVTIFECVSFSGSEDFILLAWKFSTSKKKNNKIKFRLKF